MRTDLLLGQPDGFRFRLEAKEPFSFAIVGDPHPGKLPLPEPWAASPVFARIVEELNIVSPSLVLTAGDLIQGYTTDQDTLTRQHQAFLEQIQRLEAPFLPCIGNHDVREPVSEAVWRRFWGPRYYSVDVGPCHFTVLDAEQNKDLESIAGAQLEWLREDLTLAEGSTVFVVGHRPYWKDYPLHQATWKGPGGRNYWTEDVESLFQGRDIAAIVVGHQHRFEMERIGGVLHLISGGSGGDVKDHPVDQGGIPHYMLARLVGRSPQFALVVPGSMQRAIEAGPLDLSGLWRGIAALIPPQFCPTPGDPM